MDLWTSEIDTTSADVFHLPQTKRRKQVDMIDHALFLIINLNAIKI